MSEKLPASSVQVVAIGRMGSDPKAVSERLSTASFAVGQRVKVKGTGEWENGPTQWFEIRAVNGALSEARKGDLVKVTGRQDMQSYQPEGQAARNKYGIWIESLEVLSNPKPKQDSELGFPE